MGIEAKLIVKVPAWKALKDQYTGDIQKQVDRSALNIDREAKKLVPVDTGRLKTSIGIDRGEMMADIGTNVYYAPYVEFGTSRQSAQPYLIPSFEMERPKFINALRGITEK